MRDKDYCPVGTSDDTQDILYDEVLMKNCLGLFVNWMSWTLDVGFAAWISHFCINIIVHMDNDWKLFL